MTDEEIDAFLDSKDTGPTDAELDAFLDAKEPQGDANLAGATAATQAQTLGFADEIQAAVETVPYAVGEAVAGRFDPSDIVDYYKYRRDDYRTQAGELAQSNPTATAVGTAVGVGSQLLGVNPATLARGAATGARGLLTAQGLKGAGRALLSVEGAKAVGAGAAYGAAAGAGFSEEDTLGGVAQDALEGAGTGALVGGAARGLLGSAGARVEAQGAAAEKKLATAANAERDTALVRTGLEQKQSTLGGPKRAKARAQALVEEQLPGTEKKLVDVADELSPDARLELANTLRKGAGETLGKIRDQLGQAREVTVPVAPIREEIRAAFAKDGRLASEVQEKGLEQVDAMIGKLAKDGQLTPAALRKLIEDSEALARFGTPNLELALGQARGRVFQAARAALVAREQQLIQTVLPAEAERYREAIRQYAIFSDFELGSEQFLRRANKGQKIRKDPTTEPPSGPRALFARTVAGEVGARAGSLLPIPGSTYAGAKLGESIADKWLRWTGPNSTQLSAKVQKLAILRPMMEEALRKGPAEVAKVHAMFMARNSDYRKAVEKE